MNPKFYLRVTVDLIVPKVIRETTTLNYKEQMRPKHNFTYENYFGGVAGISLNYQDTKDMTNPNY